LHKKLELPLSKSNVKLFETIGKKVKITSVKNNTISIPRSNRRYLKGTGATKEEMLNAFQNTKILD